MTNVIEIDDDTLQRFYDGDLSPLEEHGVQARIESDPLAQRRLAELGHLTEVLRESAEKLGASVNSSALYAAIEAKLSQPDRTHFGARFRLVTSEWIEHRRSALVPFVAATAVAAVTLFAVVKPGQPNLIPTASSVRLDTSAREGASGPRPEALLAGAAVSALHGTKIEDVDFGASTGTVFEIDNQGVAVAVVWISDEEVE